MVRSSLAFTVSFSIATLVSLVIVTTLGLADAGCEAGALATVLERAHALHVWLIVVLLLAFLVPWVIHRKTGPPPSPALRSVHVMVVTLATFLLGAALGLSVLAKPLLESLWATSSCNETFVTAYSNTDLALWIAVTAYFFAVVSGHFIGTQGPRYRSARSTTPSADCEQPCRGPSMRTLLFSTLGTGQKQCSP